MSEKTLPCRRKEHSIDPIGYRMPMDLVKYIDAMELGTVAMTMSWWFLNKGRRHRSRSRGAYIDLDRIAEEVAMPIENTEEVRGLPDLRKEERIE